MDTNPEKLTVVTTVQAESGGPFLVVWERQSGELTFPNGLDGGMVAKNIHNRIAAAKRSGMVMLRDSGAFWKGEADMKNPAFIRAILQAAGLYPSLEPPPSMAHLGDGYRGMDLPSELAAINPWTPALPLPSGAIA